MSTTPEKHTAKKQHQCDWCDHPIVPGERYARWRYFGNDKPMTCRLHAECYQAMLEADHEDGDEFLPGDNPRGCNCGFDHDCPDCYPENIGDSACR